MKSLIRTTCFQSFREPAERAQLLTVLLCLCSVHAQAQNVEGQIVASQYGEWKVPSIGIGFTFDPASCQLSGGGKNFAAFSNGTPIKVVDENPGLTEVSNATVYAHLDSSSCSVSLGGLAYGHTSFYLTSGTGGLQEALNNALIRMGGPNTIILNAEWYELVAPGNPATVIGAVTGGSGFGLVDVTTAPYTYYSWNGGHFNVVSGGGGAPTGAAGGSLSGTYPNPGLSSTVAIPSGATATTQTAGDNSTKIATDAFVQANLPNVPVSSVFGRAGAVGASSGDYSVAQVTGAAPLASPAFTGTPTAPTQTAGDNSTKIATDAFVLANAGGSPLWSALGTPTANLALTMAAHTSTFTYNATTGTSDLFKLTDTASNTGAGIMAHFTTASGSTEIPWQADANGVGWQVNASGNLASTNALNPATSILNPSSPTVGPCSAYWNGSASSPLCVIQQLSFASGTGGLATLGFTYSGTLPSSGARYTFDNPVILPTASTAVTQITGDNTTKVATDAFVLANGSGVSWPVTNDLVVSNSTNTPAGLAPVNGDCVIGSGGVWAVGACGGTGTTTNALTLNNSGSGAPSGTTFNGSAAVTLSYNTLGAAPLASPALTGTPTAPTQTAGNSTTDLATTAFVQSAIANCTPGAHGVINGISYTNCYTGSTFDARVNAAMTDAENLANGNTTGHVASEYEPQQVTQTGQITVGDGTHEVYWTLGAGMYDSVTLTSSTAYAVFQNPQSSITCIGSIPSNRCSFVNLSAANNIHALYSTNGTGYYALRGVSFTNDGSTLASGHMFIVNGGYDSSIWDGDTVYDSPSSNPSNGSVATFTNICCHANVTNFIADSQWGATAIELDAHFNAIDFHNITANSHGSTATGNPNILCSDSSPGLYSTAVFTGSLYLEGQSATMSQPWIEDAGCRALDFSGAMLSAAAQGGSGTTSPIIDVSSAFETTLDVGQTIAYNGSGSWTYSVTVVKQHNVTGDCSSPPCNVAVTDSAGNSPGYHGRTTQFDNLAIGGAGTAPTQTTGDNSTKIATDAFVLANSTGIWSGLGNPTGNLALTMAAHTSTFTFNAATGTSDLFKLTDTASNTGTGIMGHFTTASGSAEIPWQADANGTGWQVGTGGQLASTDTVNNAAITFAPGSGGASTCPAATSGSSFLCTNSSDGISYSNNGAAYTLLSAVPIPYTITSSASPAINLSNGSVQTITLSANATATVSNITSGAALDIQICQPSSGGPYTWTWPSAIHGGITIGATASDCSMQLFRSFNGTTLVPLSQGATNVAP